MNEVQRKLYEILIKFDALCKKHDIVYYLGGGSALGALRHKGFLPWDDDVDLYMTRKNFLKLLDVQKDFFSDDFVMVNAYNYPKYGNTLVRCVDTKSTAITKARMADGTPKGQFVEIFVMDPMPNDKAERLEWEKKHWVYTELMSLNFRVANARVDEFVDEKLYDKYKKRYNEIGREALLAELEEELFSIKEEDAVECCSRWGLRHLIYNMEWFQEPRYVPFEDIELPVATYAENVARFDYGDSWMFIPNVENQISHSFADSMTIGYKNFVNDYSQFIDIDAISNSYAHRKDQLMQMYFIQQKTQHTNQVLKSAEVLASIQYNLSLHPDLDTYYENKEFSKLENFFKIWYDNQLHASFWTYKKLIKLDDHLLFLALIPLVVKGSFSAVRKILLWRKEEENVSEELEEMFKFVDLIREVYIAIDNKDENLAQELYAKFDMIPVEYKNDQFDYLKLGIQLRINTATSNELGLLKKECERLMDMFKHNGEIISLHADILFKQNEKEKAKVDYQKAYELTRHGFVRMHIENRIKEIVGGIA